METNLHLFPHLLPSPLWPPEQRPFPICLLGHIQYKPTEKARPTNVSRYFRTRPSLEPLEFLSFCPWFLLPDFHKQGMMFDVLCKSDLFLLPLSDPRYDLGNCCRCSLPCLSRWVSNCAQQHPFGRPKIKPQNFRFGNFRPAILTRLSVQIGQDNGQAWPECRTFASQIFINLDNFTRQNSQRSEVFPHLQVPLLAFILPLQHLRLFQLKHLNQIL